MRYVTFGNTAGNLPLVLVEQEVKVPESKTAVPDSVNNFFLFDRSGSMAWDLPKLGLNLKAKIRELPEGDTITIGWFSGESGQYRFVVKGHKLQTVKDWEALDKIVDQNLSPIGLTCFSEILSDLNSVVQEVTALNPFACSLTFFTDGYPVVRDHFKENESIRKAIAAVSGKIASTLLVGYGDYYNKTLMASMADQFGGSLIHSDNVEEFTNRLQTFWTDARENGERIPVKLDCKNGEDIAFSLNGNQVIYYDTTQDTILFTPAKKGKNYIYYLTTKIPVDGKEVQLTDAKCKGSDALVKGSYALAYMLVQSTKTDLALEILSKIGDVELINMVTNSYTNAEYGAVEARILSSIIAPSKRFKLGRDTNYLPPEDAFCLKDAIDVLMKDPNAFFYPCDDRFEYKRIGRKDKTKPGYPKFKKNVNSKCSLDNLTYHDSRLNLSLRVKIDGTIDLDDQATNLGFTKVYPTFVYRNYAIVKDGILNIKVLPVSMSQPTFELFKRNGLIEDHIQWKQDGVYSIHLDATPIMNRKIAKGKTSATKMAERAIREVQLEGELKALKYFRNLDFREASMGTGPLVPAQKTYLSRFGVTSNGFNPPTEEEPTTDFYEARRFQIKLKGLAKLPKVEDVIKKMEENKKLTPVENLLAPTILRVKVLKTQIKQPSVLRAQLDADIKDRQTELRKIREELQATKFAILLGKKWFDEFSNRDESTLNYNGIEVTFSLDTEQVKF
jgi:hypothetical protein